jgi:glycosyltransferase involved in cell wall biosynthesis
VSKLRSALRRFDPALVVAHGGDPLKYLVPAMIGRRRPLVYYAIGTYAGPRDRRVRLALWRRLVARVDAVAAEGEEVEAECVRLLGVPAHRVTMTPNGRDPEQFHPGPPEPDRPLTLTFVGALTEGKRPNRFVEVVAALRARGLRFDAQVVGDGPMRASLTEAAASAGVALLGSRPDVADLLRRSDVMVFPSRSVGEGMPGVLIEAGLSGVPVAATDVPGVRTIVVDGETGMVVPEDDLGSLVSAVARLVEDPTRRLSMGRAARQRCVDRFSLESVADAWLRVLLPLLPPVSSGPGAAAPE